MIPTKKLTFAGLFLAFGILLPQIFHLLGGTGPVFLPMHLPVLISGFLLGWPYSTLIGLITPVLSSVLTAMPQPPILYFMMVELGAYGLFAGYFFRAKKWRIFPSLAGAMILGRIVLAVTVYLLQPLMGLKLSPQAYLTAALLNGLPGIALQLVFVPVLIRLIRRALRWELQTS